MMEQSNKSKSIWIPQAAHRRDFIVMLLLLCSFELPLDMRILRTSADTVTPVESVADTAYDELSTIRYQWRHILEDASITRTRRNAVTCIIGRLSVLMQVCIELGKMADTLDDEAHNTTPSAEATEICELSRHYLPKEQEQQHH
jgi:hypothetical protein